MSLKELDLSAEQKATVEKIHADLHAKMEPPHAAGKELGATLERHFNEDIQHADEIHLEEFRKRPLLDRVKESGRHLVRRVL